MKPSHRSFLVGLASLLFGSLVLLTTEIYLYSHNTLLENGKWVSSKLFPEMTPMGAHHFVLTRNALHRNHLRLGAWHGYNEVHFRHRLDPGTIRTSFRIDSGGYLCVQFNRDESGYDGIRFNRGARYPSLFFRADPIGRFLTHSPLILPPLDAGWHELALDFRGDHVTAALNGKSLFLPPTSAVRPQMFGFRSGERGTAVDNVRITDREGHLLLSETFRNTRNYGRVVSFAALGWGIVLSAVWLFRRGRGRIATYRIVAACGVFLFVGMTLYCFDFYIWSKTYPYKGYTPHGHVGSPVPTWLEIFRGRVFGNLSTELIPREQIRQMRIVPLAADENRTSDPAPQFHLAHYFSSRSHTPTLFPRDDDLDRFRNKDGEGIRVVFIGTSQTYGEGAESPQDSFVGRVHRRLVASTDLEVPIETFNFAIQGSRSGELLEAYEQHWIGVDPDLVVINLSINDGSADVLLANLRRFVELNRKHRIGVIFVVEASQRPVNAKHLGMRALGEELGIPVLDMHSYMRDDAVYDSGFLWWDPSHPTSLGHRIIAAWMAPQLIPFIEQILDRRRS